MRYHDRFCENNFDHPCKVMGAMQSGVLQKIKIMIEHVNQKLRPSVFNSIVGLITLCVYQRDQLQHMINKRLLRATDFDWEIQLKFSMDHLQQVFKKCTAQDLEIPKEKLLNLLEIPQLEIRADIFNFTKLYGFNYLGNTNRLVITPLTLKAQRSMLVAMQY